MDAQQIVDAARSLIEPGTFAVLAVKTAEGELVLRPVGGRWSSGIVEAVEEMAKKYPGCKMRVFERPGDEWERYFKGIISREQSLFYTGLPAETKEALEELRKKLFASNARLAGRGAGPE